MLLNPKTVSTPAKPPPPALPISPRVSLLDVGAVRLARGCDAESVFKSVADARHPKFLRWVFNVAVHPKGIRDLRFWAAEVSGAVDKWADPKTVIAAILGERRSFLRSELEIGWTMNATTISRLLRAGELRETEHRITRESLAAFLERRLQ
jgi:hypothetical protein